MGTLTTKFCKRLQRTICYLPSCNVNEHVSRTCKNVILRNQLSTPSTIHRHRVPLRFYSNYGSPRKLPVNLARRDTTKESISRIQMLGLAESELSKPELFNVPLGVIEQRLQYCVEGGIKCSSACITRFNHIIGSTVPVLRSAGFITEKTDVVQRMMSSIKFVGPLLPSIDADLTFCEIHFKVLNHCMEYEYGYSFPNWARYQEAPVVYAHRNMVSVKEAGLSWSWIRNHPSLLCFANPHNLFKLFQLDRNYELPYSVPNIVRKDSDIAFVPYEDLKAIFFILKKYNVCSHDMLRVGKMEHFLINPDYLDRLFQKIDTEPRPDKNNLMLLYKQSYLKSEKKRTEDHLEKLISKQCNPYTNLSNCKEGSWQHEMKLWLECGNSSLELNPCQHKPFGATSSEDYLQDYSDVSYSVDEIKVELKNKKKSTKLPFLLADELNLPIQQVKTELARLPLALTIEAKHAYETLNFLLSKGFTRQEIGETLQLLLYKKDVVEEVLEEHIFPDKELESETYRERRLHVCLYHILVKYNFNLCTN
ncbi:uncharacterized protein LOC113204536 [Frankliniella occidentalis]|uniref:Uncharacterized protein LOC113204536 n=1 Tax=Frankliniella occidentalis TaxID=133901 RepID=A0A6J1S3C5_FRAOC|nr:uncharacterized protein LOC113204536 [Frankliniella occidentalis]